jgi:RIO kinase 2
MSSIEIAAGIVRTLEIEDFKLLKVFASGMKHHESLTKEQVVNYSKQHRNSIGYRIGRLHKMKLLGKKEAGYTLLMAGLDAIALKTLADKDMIVGMGRPIGIGKESDVIKAVTSSGEERAIKFFRIGRISFRDARRKRTYGNNESIHNWLLMNIEAAKKEYDILEALRGTGIRIPTAYYRAMHSIVMNNISGSRLVDLKKLRSPATVLQDILNDIRICYNNNIINCDISEYNTIFDVNERVWIIDWPQAVSRKHPNANELIKRDVFNIVKFFNRRFGTKKVLEEALIEVITPPVI